FRSVDAPALAAWFKADAVVLDGQLQSAVQRAQSDTDLAGTGVSPDVPQSFLRDAKQSEGRLPRHGVGQIAQVHIAADRFLPGEAFAFGLERFGQAEVVQERWM